MLFTRRKTGTGTPYRKESEAMVSWLWLRKCSTSSAGGWSWDSFSSRESYCLLGTGVAE